VECCASLSTGSEEKITENSACLPLGGTFLGCCVDCKSFLVVFLFLRDEGVVCK
jgi:hypothetical protein